MTTPFEDRFTHLKDLVKPNFPNLTSAEAELFTKPGRILAPLPAALYEHTSERTSERRTLGTKGAAGRQDRLNPDRQIRSELIEFLCTDSAVREHRYFSIKASWARFDSRLNLSHLEVPWPLHFEDCEFPVGIDLLGASLSDLILIRCELGSRSFAKGPQILQAESLRASGAVVFRGVKAYGELRFAGASIGRTFSFSEATLTHESAIALTLDRADIGGNLYLRREFESNGEISLLGARIHGSLDCSAATLNNPNQVALRADFAVIDGSVLMSAGHAIKSGTYKNLRVHGEIRLYGAVINGNLDCTGAIIDNGPLPEATCLNAESAAIHGAVFLGFSIHEIDKHPGEWGFEATGRVRFFDASIGSHFICHAGLFQNPGGVALDLERAHIAGSFFPRFRFKAHGELCLVSTTIEDGLDFAGADLSEASLRICDTEIKRTLNLAHVEKPVQTIFDLTDTSCGVLTDDPKKSWPADGVLKLDGFSYRRLTNPHSAADRLAWLRRQLHPTANSNAAGFRPQPYRQLASVLRAEGLDDEAKKVLIGMTEDSHKWGAPSLGSRILFLTIRNGYQPLRAFKALALLWLFGFIVFGIAYQNGLISPSDKDAYQKLTPGYESFCAPAYAIDSSLPIISFGQRDKWRPNWPNPAAAGKPSGGGAFAAVCEVNFAKHWLDWIPDPGLSTRVLCLKLIRWAYIAVGWFLTTMFVAGISGLAARI